MHVISRAPQGNVVGYVQGSARHDCNAVAHEGSGMFHHPL